MKFRVTNGVSEIYPDFGKNKLLCIILVKN